MDLIIAIHALPMRMRDLVDMHILVRATALSFGANVNYIKGCDTERYLFLSLPDDSVHNLVTRIQRAVRPQGSCSDIGFTPSAMLKIDLH